MPGNRNMKDQRKPQSYRMESEIVNAIVAKSIDNNHAGIAQSSPACLS